jgi:hypothetical protein
VVSDIWNTSGESPLSLSQFVINLKTFFVLVGRTTQDSHVKKTKTTSAKPDRNKENMIIRINYKTSFILQHIIPHQESINEMIIDEESIFRGETGLRKKQQERSLLQHGAQGSKQP